MSLDQLIPCGEMLLVRRDPPELRCGEILIPGTANLGVTTSGVVVRVGPRAEGVFAEGNRVIFGILAGLSLASEGASSEEEYRLVPAGDIQCRILTSEGSGKVYKMREYVVTLGGSLSPEERAKIIGQLEGASDATA